MVVRTMRYLIIYFKKFVSFNTFLILLILCLLLFVIYKPEINLKSMYSKNEVYYPNSDIIERSNHSEIIKSYYDKRKHWQTSNLGSLLFKNIPLDAIQEINGTQKRKFLILIWKYWKWLENRHVYNFNSQRKGDPLSQCSVNNCIFTGDDSKLSTADAVVIHIQRGVFPNTTERNPEQRWVFLSDESPKNSFSMTRNPPTLLDMANIFNWSMTYRSNSDVPVPYGRTVPLQKPIKERITYKHLISLVPNWNNKRRDVLASILISNCGVSRRMKYLEELQEYITVDVFGLCSKNHKESCPGHFRSDCNIMSDYLFYLVFENSECQEYLTEKSFYHAYSKGAIPVIMGPTTYNSEYLLPPNSFLHVDNYKSPLDLAKHMVEISKSEKTLLSYHRWRNDFEVVNEHGYFGSKSFHLCRICEALNYNDVKEKVYDEDKLKIFFDPDLSCR